MTVETPSHAERLLLFDHFHLTQVAMTGGASDAFGDMNAVIEIGIIGKFVHFYPLHRLAGGVAFTNRKEFLALWKNERVAVHAGLRGGYY